MTHAPPPGEQRLYALDAARAVAALAVVFQHWEHFLSVPAFAAPIEASPLYAVFAPLYEKGARAVTFFFCLSGFIFVWLYAGKVHARKVGPATFAMLRLSRLYPLHLATLGVVLFLQWPALALLGQPFIYQHQDAAHFALNLFLVQYWGFEAGYSFNGPSWSISVEIFLYVAFFLACRWLRPSIWVCVGLTGLSLLLARYSVLASASSSFFIGGGVFFIYRMLASRWSALFNVGLVLLAALAWSVLPIALGPDMLAQLPDTSLGRAAFWLANHAFEFVLFPVTVLALALTERAWPRIPWRWLHELGNMSFGLYLLHFPLQLAVVLVGVAVGLPKDAFTQPIALVAFFAALLILAAASYHWFEKPAMDAIRRAWPGKASQAPGPATSPGSTPRERSVSAP